MNFSIDLSKSFFRYSVDVDYNFDRSHCECTDMCRCGIVTDTRVRSIPMDRIVEIVDVRESYKDKRGANRNRAYKLSLIERYCIDRLARVHQLYDTSLYSVSVVGGYYGQEVDGVELDGLVERKFLADVETVMYLPDDISKIKFILKAEYAFVLDLVKDTNAVRVVKMKDYQHLFKNVDYALRVKNNGTNSYDVEEGLPRGIVYDGRLIDGYHRMASWETGAVKLIEMVKE